MSSRFLTEYKTKLVSAEKAVEGISDGSVIIHGVTIAEPPALLQALADRARAGDLRDVCIYSFNPQKTASKTYLQPDLLDVIKARCWFLSPVTRTLASAGLVQFIPCYLHQVPKFIREYMDVDVCLTMVSPMDRAGFFTFGTANDLTSTAARQAKRLIVEVNRNMPRVFGDSLVHISEVHSVIENHTQLLQIPAPEINPLDARVGRRIAEIIPDGAVLQLGIGTLPNAICPELGGHKDLGIHSELFGPGMMDLILKGVVTGRKKAIHPRKHVFSVAYGTDEVFDFMDDNPSMASFPSDYVMDPAVISQNDHMIAVNSILEVDLTGQCNAEHLAGFQFSGTGGQLDFVRGAYAARGGKSIMTLYSTAKNGTISRIVPMLERGVAVTTPRMDVHYLCTEHGLVNLKHRTVGERAELIISIADPAFRGELTRQAQEMRLF
ncbi:MAG: acetyl-CoA hydrolase/transferase family protein [Deltaproteobacteria bacterium]|nr:acetyl-CoA hydrolase/transferase family protein [Deltaproteobacteria bacterium]